MYVKAVCSWGLEEPKASSQEAQVHWTQGMEGQRERKGRASRDRNTFRTERQEANIICQEKVISAQFGSPGRVGSGQGGTGRKVKYFNFRFLAYQMMPPSANILMK